MSTKAITGNKKIDNKITTCQGAKIERISITVNFCCVYDAVLPNV